MNHFSLKIITLISSVTGMIGCVPVEKEVQRPNILHIMSDEHACQAISAYGHGYWHISEL